MTTTIAYAATTDGSLFSVNATYSTARAGSGLTVDTADPSRVYYGQRPTYTIFQAFIRFTVPSLAAGAVVTSAAIRVNQTGQVGTGIVRDMELRSYDWGTSLDTADWRGSSALSPGAPLHGVVRGVQASQGKFTTAGSEALRAILQVGNTTLGYVAVSSRQRAGTVPTTGEESSFASAENAGTTLDPCLVYTTLTDHNLIPVMGAEARLSDGTWVFLTAATAGSVSLDWEKADGTTTTLATFSLGTSTTQWADVPAAQGMSLCVDSADNIYVVGCAGDAPNSIRHRAHVKAGTGVWTTGTTRTIPLPTHDSPVNNITCAWSPAGGGTLAVFASHAAGDGVSGGDDGDVAYVLLNSQYLLDGVTGSQLRASGSAIAAGILPAALASGEFSGYLNETGTGLDVVSDPGQTDWCYLVSFQRASALGGNYPATVGRFNLNTTANGFDFTDNGAALACGTKDASAKLRAISVGTSQVAVVSADGDSGYGLSVQVLQHNGNVAGWVSLAYIRLASESIPSMPDGPAVKTTLAWDAVYSATENALWVYYVKASDPTQVMRTSISLDTYKATRVEVPVFTAGASVVAIRTPRNARVTQTTHVTVATATGYSRVRDTFNQAPLAPVLTTRLNYDATQAGTFAWTFKDPNAGDTQKAYQLQVVRVSDGATVLDTGKVLSAGQTYTLAAGTLTNGVDYQWRVMTWDALDVAGPWSPYGSFSTSASGTVNITTPATDNPPGVITDDYQVSWTVTGATQASFRVWVTRNDTGQIIHDSFPTTGTQTTWRITDMVSDVEHTIRVVASSSTGVGTNTATRKITPSFGKPEVPLVTLTPVPEEGYVLVSVDNPPPGSGEDPGVLYDFEDGTTEPLNTSGSGTLASSTTYAHKGTRSIQVTNTVSPGATVRTKSTSAKAVTPGRRYTASFWCYSTTGYASHNCTINWKGTDPAGAILSTSTGPATNVPANTWTLVSVTAQAPDGASWALYGPGFSPSPAVGYVYYMDELGMGLASDAPDVVRNRILRRPAGSTGPWEDLGETGPDGSFRDYTAPARVPVEYVVRGESS